MLLLLAMLVIEILCLYRWLKVRSEHHTISAARMMLRNAQHSRRIVAPIYRSIRPNDDSLPIDTNKYVPCTLHTLLRSKWHSSYVAYTHKQLCVLLDSYSNNRLLHANAAHAAAMSSRRKRVYGTREIWLMRGMSSGKTNINARPECGQLKWSQQKRKNL